MNKKTIANIALSAVCLGCAVSVSAKNDAKSAKSAAAPVEEVAVVAQEEIEYYPATSADIRLDGEWNIDNVNGQKVTGEERPFITFDLSQGRIYGNNGCNIVNADAVTGKGNKLQFTGMMSTQKYCANAPFEHLINTTLDQVRSYKISRYGHEYYLDLFNDRGHLIMVLRKHNMDFLNGAWRVTAINGQPNSNEGVQFVFDLPEKKIHGNAGCNIINGEISIDPDVTNSVQFSNIASTRMMCPDIATETAVLVALEETEKAFAKSDDTVTFVNHAGKPVLQLIRIDPRSLTDGE
ncbi:MAG: hypothetical protein BHV69_10605 [Bacteroidales bacterium 52_46]|nr:MAG: hypothetical protein BHV69_10605 [Bacteroidales bacterium 52_46]